MPYARLEIEGKDFGWVKLNDEAHKGEANGTAFFCEYCGRVWAKAVVDGRRIYPYSINCGCQPTISWVIVPGSIWLSWDYDWQQGLPRAALEREFEVHLKHYERWKGSYDFA